MYIISAHQWLLRCLCKKSSASQITNFTFALSSYMYPPFPSTLPLELGQSYAAKTLCCVSSNASETKGLQFNCNIIFMPVEHAKERKLFRK
jgi:hypothetical protein